MKPHAIRPLAALTLAAVVALAGVACGGKADVTEETGEQSTSPTGVSSNEEDASGTSTAIGDDAILVEVTISGDEVTPNAERVEAEIGQPVVFRITSDVATEIHGHATPEFTWSVEPGTVEETLVYDEPVSVTIELHDPPRTLVQLIVR